MAYVFATIALLSAYLVWQLVRIWRTSYAEACAEVGRKWNSDRNLIEIAPWFGTTGLAEEVEREMPRYLRRELGEVGAGEDGLKAADLTYLGIQTDELGPAHFWSIRREKEGAEVYAYAYIGIDEQGHPVGYGWGDRTPEMSS